MPVPSPDITFDSARFRSEREEDWKRLEEILHRAESGLLSALSEEELLDLPVLYRSALSSLSVARATSLDVALVAYLEALCTRAYYLVYGLRSGLGGLFVTFLRTGWPRAVHSLWAETLAAFGLILVGAIAGYNLVTSDAQWYYAIIPAELAQGREPGATAAVLRESLGGGDGYGGLGVFAAALFTHNVQIALGAFALGFAFGVPTALLLVYNGTVVGAFAAIYADAGLAAELGGWLLIHGSTEFFAIVLAGAAGLHVARNIVFPGRHSRLSAARAAGHAAARVMIGTAIMFLVAGLLEGFARQLITDTVARYAVAGSVFVVWCAYFYAPGLRHEHG